jgi:hypothetical protein
MMFGKSVGTQRAKGVFEHSRQLLLNLGFLRTQRIIIGQLGGCILGTFFISHFLKSKETRDPRVLLAPGSIFDPGPWIFIPAPAQIPRLFHIPSTRAFVFSSIKISSGHGRVNPSVSHFRVASIPIFDPKSCIRAA